MTPILRRASLLLLAALLAVGCTAPVDSDRTESDDGPATGTSAATSTALVDDVPAPDTAPSTTTSTGTSTSTSGRAPATSTPEGTVSSHISVTTSPALPGGTVGLVDLVRSGWLDAEGRFRLTAATAAQVTEAEATGTVCEFLFGSVAEVAALTLLPAVSTLGELSGPQLGGEALRFACVYDVGGAPALVLQVGSGPEIDPDLPGGPIIVTVGNLQAVLSYAPGRSGIDPELAERYLTEAAGRLTVG